MAYRQPPVVSEIAKAYQNDPRTKLAMQAIAAGSSTAPVAEGKYAYLDGAARALQGIVGGYVDRKQRERYGADEAALVSQIAARGRAGAAGLDASAAAAASALGAPPPATPQGQEGPISVPPFLRAPVPGSAPPQVPGAPGVAPPQGAAPGVAPQRPFSGGAAPSDNGVPLEVRPERPTARGRNISPRLRTAYETMAGANRYEIDAAREMLDKGLGEQNANDAAEIERQQTLDNAEYQAALGRYASDREQVRNQNFQTAHQARDFAHQDSNREDEQQFTLTRDEKQFVREMKRAGYDRETSYGLARLNNDAAYKRTLLEIEARKASDAEKTAARQQAFFGTRTGADIYDKATQRMQKNEATKALLGKFTDINNVQRTGGLILGNAPDAVKWANGTWQTMDAITQQLSIDLSGALKGAVSDKEGARILATLPSIRNKRDANTKIAATLSRALDRANNYEINRLEAMANGTQTQFARDWDAYRNAVSVYASDQTFEDWKANLKSYDKNGNLVK